MLGLAARDAGTGAVVLIDGVVRPLTPVPALGVADTLGPLEWRGGREEYMPARGVAAGSIAAMEAFRLGIGVEGTRLVDSGASDSGGDGGVVSGRKASVLLCGGVEAAVGEDSVVADVEASDTGERGRNESPARWFDTLRW